MYIILSYDVNKKRCSKYLRLCKKYLLHYQNSFFVGSITLGRYNQLLDNINKLKKDNDSIIIYEIPSIKYINKIMMKNFTFIES